MLGRLACGILLLFGTGACRAVGASRKGAEVPPEHSQTNTVSEDVVPPGEDAQQEGRVVSVCIDETGDSFWDGEAVSSEALRERLSALKAKDTVAWLGGDPAVTMSESQKSWFEYIVKLGVKTIVVPRADPAASSGEGRPLTVNTRYIREALDLYDRLKGQEGETRRLLPADVVVRLDPDAERVYVLRRVEIGLAGSPFWVVHESLSDRESATSIQFKKEW